MAETESNTSGKNPNRVAAGKRAAAARAQNAETMPTTASTGNVIGNTMSGGQFPWLKTLPAAHRESALIGYGAALAQQQSGRSLTTASGGGRRKPTRRKSSESQNTQTTG